MTRERDDLRAQLEARLGVLDARLAKIDGDLRRPGDRDWTEQASQRENDEVLESLAEAERVEAAAIRAALARLQEGRFGACERCGEDIAPARLAAMPTTTTCIGCAA